jgi:hypothetical protein
MQVQSEMQKVQKKIRSALPGSILHEPLSL